LKSKRKQIISVERTFKLKKRFRSALLPQVKMFLRSHCLLILSFMRRQNSKIWFIRSVDM